MEQILIYLSACPTLVHTNRRPMELSTRLRSGMTGNAVNLKNEAKNTNY